jgi:regulator of protease activity HflC (stomatin/prohibitin superfamily)
MYLEDILSIIFQPTIWFFILVVVILRLSIKFVPHNRTYLIERFGKFNTVQQAGLNFIIPFIDRVSADRSLKEQAVDIDSQSAITKDNIYLSVDGVLYFRVLDPYKATYGVDDYVFAVTQLAQTTMRSELGKMELDKTFEERDLLNTNIVVAINQASAAWGVQVLRYEIKDIVPPQSVMQAMEAQMKAERVKRAQILESEGDRQAAINRAEGKKASVVLAAEAEKEEQVLRAEGEAKALVAVADAQAAAGAGRRKLRCLRRVRAEFGAARRAAPVGRRAVDRRGRRRPAAPRRARGRPPPSQRARRRLDFGRDPAGKFTSNLPLLVICEIC